MISHVNHDIQDFLGTDDEVVNKTKWSPLISGGKNFKSHNLFTINDNRLQFRISLRATLFYFLFILTGATLLFLSLFKNMLDLDFFNNPVYGGVMGLVFTVAGLFFFYKNRTKITIDRSYPALWRGDIDPAATINPYSIDGYISLNDLHAIQVIREYISSEHKSFSSYEINLVFHDGSRVNVIDHGDKNKILEQSHQLADFLGVPLWDGRRDTNREFRRFVMKIKQIIMLIFIVLILAAFWFIYQEVQMSHTEDLSYQTDSQEYTTELFEALKSGHYNISRLNTLIKHGANVNERDSEGRTPLFYAVLARDYAMVNSLIHAHADIHVKDNLGMEVKDLLDKKKDQTIYFTLEDAQLKETARSQGKKISGVDRTFDQNGNVISLQIYYDER